MFTTIYIGLSSSKLLKQRVNFSHKSSPRGTEREKWNQREFLRQKIFTFE